MRLSRVAVHVTPRSGRDEIVGWERDELHVRVKAPAEGGRANTAVCALLGIAIRVPKSSVKVVRGASSRHKTLEIAAADDVDVTALLGGR
jgi:uncharacterized protein (TIGR00251 family)